jgi:alkylation response protein AidB-like acyl-CoA dehydrogenase
MNFELTDEQAMIRDSLTRYLRERHDFETRGKLLAADGGRALWQALAGELGLLGATFPQAVGGFGGGAVEAMVVMEALGGALVVSPYLETVVLAGSLLRHAGGDKASALMAGIVGGNTLVAVGVGEAGTRFGRQGIRSEARRDGDGFRLDGAKTVVVGAADAQYLLILALLEDRPALFLVDAGADGLSRQDYPLIDERRASDIVLAGVRLGADSLLAADASEIVDRAFDEATAALCAEAVGVMRRMLADTIDYTRQRRQFDQPLASFQALQHRMVDMYMQVEQSVSATYLATLNLDAEPAIRARAVSAAKVTIAKALRQVGQEAVQMHGGMGLTELLPVGHYFKRATVMEHQFGSADYHVARYAALARAA